VTCRTRPTLSRRRRVPLPRHLLIAAAGTLLRPSIVFAQQPSPPPVSVYRAPAIALATPIAGTAIPADKPVIVLRFAQGETDDPIDPSSLRVSVDGQDRTSLLQLGTGEAWGPLAPMTAPNASAAALAAAVVIASGVHLVHARLCSMRGVCSTLDVPVTVSPADPTAVLRSGISQADSTAQQSKPSRLRQVVNLVIAGARKLLTP
jgi:hypothetical protein